MKSIWSNSLEAYIISGFFGGPLESSLTSAWQLKHFLPTCVLSSQEGNADLYRKKAIKMKKFFEVCVEKYVRITISQFLRHLEVTMHSLFLATKVLSTLFFQYIYTQVVVVFFGAVKLHCNSSRHYSLPLNTTLPTWINNHRLQKNLLTTKEEICK